MRDIAARCRHVPTPLERNDGDDLGSLGHRDHPDEGQRARVGSGGMVVQPCWFPPRADVVAADVVALIPSVAAP